MEQVKGGGHRGGSARSYVVVAHVSKGGMAEGVAAQVRTAAQVRVAAQVGVAGWRLRREALYEGWVPL